MTVKELKEEIISMIAEATQTEMPITLNTHLIRELGLTSVETMMLVSDLEDRFACNIPGKLLRDVWTVGDLCEIVIHVLK